MIPNILTIGEPGSGKSVGTASAALAFPGARLVLDPHKDSLALLVLEHAEGEILFDRISDLDHSLGYGLLGASTQGDANKRLQENRRRAKLFVEVMMRRRGGDIAGSPLMDEWIMALLMLYLYQECRNGQTQKDPGIIPHGFMPDTPPFDSLLRDCALPDLRLKFGQLVGLKPKALRSEVGSAARLVNGVFGDPSFLLRCRSGFDLGAFLQNKGTLIVERGDADEDVTRTIMGGINMIVTDHCENRPMPYPPVAMILDECTNARTAGPFEEKKAGETRKVGLHWWFICQHPNFPGGPDGYFQNCQEKHFYRTGDHALARKLAGFVVGAMRRGEKSRAELTDEVVADLMTFAPGWRYVVGPNGSRKEYVPLLKNPWPDWPGLREAKLEEKLCRIHARPEYGVHCTTSDTTSCEGTQPPPPNSPSGSSAAQRWKSGGRKPAGGS